MKRIKLDSTFIFFLAGLVLTVLLFASLTFLKQEMYIRIFFFRSWYIQSITTWLFFTAILYMVTKYVELKQERKILREKVTVEGIGTISSGEADQLLTAIPDRYREAIGFRRLTELLRGFLHGEEIVRLNQELSRREVDQMERGHHVLNALKQLVPILGFLGTVVGLSIAMVEFSDLADNANVDMLRQKLKGMGASLSVAFETTVLALGYAIILVLVSSLLSRREEAFIAEVDDKARLLISKLSRNKAATIDRSVVNFGDRLETWLNEWKESVSTAMQDVVLQLSAQREKDVARLRETLSTKDDALLLKLDQMTQVLRKPPRYEIIVQPSDERDKES